VYTAIESDSARLRQVALDDLCSAINIWGESEELADVYQFGC